jgi:hypothetical protein
MFIPQEKVIPLQPRALGSFFVASYDSQGYGGGILTRLHMGISVLAEQSSYVMTGGRSVSQYVLVPSPPWAREQTLFPVWRFLSEIPFLVSVGRHLWREVGSVILCLSLY